MNPASWHVLGIDDSLTIRKLLEMVFSRAGYSYEVVATGEEGISRAKRTPPHLILLDYVLPDMKGLDVANALAEDERTKGIPIVLMSAKSDDLRGLFRGLPSVVEFVSKPFTPPEITFLVADLLEKRGRQAGSGPSSDAKPLEKVVEPAPSLFTHGQKETAARALFARLRDRFAQIPDWSRALGDSAPAPYFAKKILTPELMDGLLGALAPTYQEVLGQGTRTVNAANGDAPLLQGQTNLIPLTHLMKELLACGRTGVLVLEGEARRTYLYLRRGEAIFATHNRPDEYARQASLEVAGATPEEIAQAEAEQRHSGKPVFVTYAAAGKFAISELPAVLYQQGKRVLLEATSAGPAPFEWVDQSALPSYVDAYGRPYSLDQLSLERLRLVDDWAQVEVKLHVPSLDMVFRRGEGFSASLRRFELTDNERRVLTLVDGRNTVRHIIERSGLPTFEVFHVLFRIGQVGLVRRGEDGAAATGAPRDGRPVVILELDVEGIVDPLAHLLRRRRQPIALVNIGGTGPDIVAALLKERPRLFLMNVAASAQEPRSLARDIRSRLEISDVPLVAVLDNEDAARSEELAAAGFDAVVVKPFAVGEIEKFLAA